MAIFVLMFSFWDQMQKLKAIGFRTQFNTSPKFIDTATLYAPY